MILAFWGGTFFGHVWDILGDVGEAFWYYGGVASLVLLGGIVAFFVWSD